MSRTMTVSAKIEEQGEPTESVSFCFNADVSSCVSRTFEIVSFLEWISNADDATDEMIQKAAFSFVADRLQDMEENGACELADVLLALHILYFNDNDQVNWYYVLIAQKLHTALVIAQDALAAKNQSIDEEKAKAEKAKADAKPEENGKA